MLSQYDCLLGQRHDMALAPNGTPAAEGRSRRRAQVCEESAGPGAPQNSLAPREEGASLPWESGSLGSASTAP